MVGETMSSSIMATTIIPDQAFNSSPHTDKSAGTSTNLSPHPDNSVASSSNSRLNSSVIGATSNICQPGVSEDSDYIPRVCQILAAVRQQQQQLKREQQQQQYTPEKIQPASERTPRESERPVSADFRSSDPPSLSRTIRKRHTFCSGSSSGFSEGSSSSGGGQNGGGSRPVLVQLRTWAARRDTGDARKTIRDAVSAPVARSEVRSSSVATQTHHVSKSLRLAKKCSHHVSSEKVSPSRTSSSERFTPVSSTESSSITMKSATSTSRMDSQRKAETFLLSPRSMDTAQSRTPANQTFSASAVYDETCRVPRLFTCGETVPDFTRDPPSFTSFTSHQPSFSSSSELPADGSVLHEAINPHVQLPAHFLRVTPFTHSTTERDLPQTPSSTSSQLHGSKSAAIAYEQIANMPAKQEFSSKFAAEMARSSFKRLKGNHDLPEEVDGDSNMEHQNMEMEVIKIRSTNHPLAPSTTYLRCSLPPSPPTSPPPPLPSSSTLKLNDGENPNLVEEMIEPEKTFLPRGEEDIDSSSAGIDMTEVGVSRLNTSNTADSYSLASSAEALAAAEISPESRRQSSALAKHQIVVAIDFGTTYSGYAFSFLCQPNDVHIMRKSEGGDPGLHNQKIPTALLLKPDGTFAGFGFEARDIYHDLEATDAANWLFFDRFKLSLHRDTSINQDTFIPAANGQCVSAMTVFTYALVYFRQRTLNELADLTRRQLDSDVIRWVITVPAIWRQHAKQFMRHAAYQANLGSRESPDSLLIALEPEVASVYCQSLPLHQLTTTQNTRNIWSWSEANINSGGKVENCACQNTADNLETGTRYLVVDCGGGTVDVTVHEVFDSKRRKLKELYKASGGPYGSVGVDLQFIHLLGGIFSPDFISSFRLKQPASWVDVMVAFEARKRSATPETRGSTNINLPYKFISDYKKCKGKKVENAVKLFKHGGVSYSDGTLRLDSTVMYQLFRPTLDKIAKQIQQILEEVGGLKYLYLVGGFSESKLLQSRIKAEFAKSIDVIIPQDVSLVVLRGAVTFGCDPALIEVRRSALTYGVGVLNKFMHGLHPKSKLLVRDGREWCVDVFDKFVTVDQSVGVGETLIRRYTPAKPGQTYIVLHIYSSHKEKVKFVTDEDVEKCATLKMKLSEPSESSPTKREIQVRMYFGDTEIRASAIDIQSQREVSCEINFL